MLGVCFGYDAFSYSRNEWAYMLDNFGVTHVWEHGYNAEEVRGYPKSTIVEKAVELPEVPLVLLAPEDGRQVKGSQCLYDFSHPVGDAIYISGQNNVQFDPEFIEGREVSKIYIPSEEHEFFALVAMSVALYDRRAKEWAR